MFEVKEVTCQICGQPLGTSKIHSGMRGGSILYTNQNPFKDVAVKVKECTSIKCRAMHRVWPSEEGTIFLFFSIVLSFISSKIAKLHCCIHVLVFV